MEMSKKIMTKNTFKAAIDMLTKYGYIIDDNWKFVNGITYVGGGPEVWNKRLKRDNIIVEHNNLPDELTIDWWKSECSEDYNDLFIRILIEKEKQRSSLCKPRDS